MPSLLNIYLFMESNVLTFVCPFPSLMFLEYLVVPGNHMFQHIKYSPASSACPSSSQVSLHCPPLSLIIHRPSFIIPNIPVEQCNFHFWTPSPWVFPPVNIIPKIICPVLGLSPLFLVHIPFSLHPFSTPPFLNHPLNYSHNVRL